MAQVRKQLLKMLRIQQLVLEIQNARAIIDSGPGRIEEIEGRFRERNAEYVALKDRHDTLEADRSARALELTTLEDAEPYPLEVGGVRLLIGTFLLHLATHFAYHLGQLDYHRRVVTGAPQGVGAQAIPELAHP